MPPVTTQPLLDGALVVTELDLLIHANAGQHATGRFRRGLHPSSLVVRRGQPFNIAIRFNRKYMEARDNISLIFCVNGEGIESHV